MMPAGLGYRGVRVGEASHPGPPPESGVTASYQAQHTRHGTRIVAYNVGSLHRHLDELISTAVSEDAQFLVVQETGITQTQTPGLSHRVRRMGWNISSVPAGTLRGGGRGGIAILSKEPFTTIVLHQAVAEAGQLLSVQVFGMTEPWVIHCGYRRPTFDDSELLHELSAAIAVTKHRPWVFACDWNDDPYNSDMQAMLQDLGGRLVATSQHRASSRPTDSVWIWGDLSAVSSKLPFLSDHTGAGVELAEVQSLSPKPAWGFKPVQAMRPSRPATPPFPPEDWWKQQASTEETWNAALQTKDVDVLWDLWTKDAEKFLASQQLLASCKGTRARGSAPSLVPGASFRAPSQSTEERQLRRFLRRLDEIRTKEARGHHIPQQLLRRTWLNARLWGWQEDVSCRAWGRCQQHAGARLQDLLRRKAEDAIVDWKRKIRTLPGACKWAKAKEPPPWLLEHMSPHHTEGPRKLQAVGQAAGAHLLKQAWEPVFCANPGYSTSIEQYLQRYGAFLEPPKPEVPLPTLTKEDLRRTVASMTAKASGLDGWDSEALLCLPSSAWTRLLDLIQCVEQVSKWPSALTHWKLVFLPKPCKGAETNLTSALNTRPIAVGPIIYRAWGKLRWKQLSHVFASALHGLQVGGTAKHDAESLVCAVMGEARDKEYGASLDFKKAFDSTDWPLSAHLLKRAGIPTPVANAIAAMWKDHVRWCTFGKCTAPEPIKQVLGLPQGDPWSPIGLALVLAGPVRKLAAETSLFQVTFLDDRTAFGNSVQDIRAFFREWTCFEQLGRLKTNQEKTQIFASSMVAKLNLQRWGWTAKNCMEVLGTVLGPVSRENTPKEQSRQDEVSRIARRVATLPVSLSFKRTLIATLLCPKAVWGWTINGRIPPPKVANSFLVACKDLWRGSGFSRSHASVPLFKALGPTWSSFQCAAPCRP